ncbi:MAG: LysR family transcriptional regulator [Alphaproteobacteria bacterium]|nr:LysR family transcriptional regulator [Alphaproteobacteria bacterium]
MKRLDDIPYFLAVARWGSLSEAAKRLGSSQPTVGRRISALEDELGLILFDRVNSGYALTEAGKLLIEKAAAVERAATALGEEALNQHRRVRKTIRVSATEGLGVYVLTPILTRFGRESPKTTLELIVDNDAVDILQREAEIAVRLVRPIVPDLIARRVGTLSFQLFASREYLRNNAPPNDLREISRHSLVTFSQRSSIQDETWQDIVNCNAGAKFTTNSSLAQIAAIRAGFGVGLVATYVGAMFDDLVPILGSELWRKREIWLAAHPDMKKVPIIGETYKHIARYLKAL